MRRTSTAKWSDKYRRWQINVQKNGIRRSFYSSAPGRTGQRECNAKADAWLDDNITGNRLRVRQATAQKVYDIFIKALEKEKSDHTKEA